MDRGSCYEEALPKDLRRMEDGIYRNKANNKQKNPTLWNPKTNNQSALEHSHKTFL